MSASDFCLFGDFKSVVDLDAQIPHGRFQRKRVTNTVLTQTLNG